MKNNLINNQTEFRSTMFLKFIAKVHCEHEKIQFGLGHSGNTPAEYADIDIVVQVSGKEKLNKREIENLANEMIAPIYRLLKRHGLNYNHAPLIKDPKNALIECEKQDAHFKAVFSEQNSFRVTATEKNVVVKKTQQERYVYEYSPTIYVKSTEEQHSPPKQTNIVVETKGFPMNPRSFETIGHGLHPLIKKLLEPHGVDYDYYEIVGQERTRKHLTLCKEVKEPHISVTESGRFVYSDTGRPLDVTTA